MSIESARNKLRHAKKDLEELKDAKGDHAEFDRQLSHFLSDTRDALDHLAPNSENHEVNEWDHEARQGFKLWYKSLKKIWKSRLNENRGEIVIWWLHKQNITDKHDHNTELSHMDTSGIHSQFSLMEEREEPPKTRPSPIDGDHEYYFVNPLPNCKDISVVETAEIVLSEIEQVFENMDNRFPTGET